jgi:hypothetical protein
MMEIGRTRGMLAGVMTALAAMGAGARSGGVSMFSPGGLMSMPFIMPTRANAEGKPGRIPRRALKVKWRNSGSKYMPHQGERECARRRLQMARFQLTPIFREHPQPHPAGQELDDHRHRRTGAGVNRLVTWLLKLRILVPYENIGTYMGRWWLIRERRGMPLAARIHNIKRSDAGRDLHNHPWWYCTLILAGGYWEHTQITEAEYWDRIVSLRWRSVRLQRPDRALLHAALARRGIAVVPRPAASVTGSRSIRTPSRTAARGRCSSTAGACAAGVSSRRTASCRRRTI